LAEIYSGTPRGFGYSTIDGDCTGFNTDIYSANEVGRDSFTEL